MQTGFRFDGPSSSKKLTKKQLDKPRDDGPKDALHSSTDVQEKYYIGHINNFIIIVSKLGDRGSQEAIKLFYNACKLFQINIFD